VNDEPRDVRDPLGLLPEFHRSTRMPLDAVVRLHFEGTVAYQNGFAANVSALGMFVKHPDPPAVGTRLVFEFVLGDERKPVQGAGVVSWMRERYEGPGRSAGVGIRFTELDALSRQHIAEALFEFLESQLGVEVADHPDMPNLLAAMPRASALEVGEDGQLDLPAAAEEEAPPLEELVASAEPTAGSGSSFRLFGDDAESLEELADDPSLAAQPDLFAPVVPPEFDASLGETAVYGAARRRAPSLWVSFGIPLVVAAAGFAGWWFWLGPGAEARHDEQPVETAPAQTAQTAPRPPLDPSPGPSTTLAESVGAPSAGPAASTTPVATGETDSTESADVATDVAESSGDQQPAMQPAGDEASTIVSGARFSHLTGLRWNQTPGRTEVVLTGDGSFPPDSYRWFEIRDDKPRVLVRLTGVAAGYAQSAIEAGTQELAGVRVGFHEKPGGNELHVVLDLGARDVRVASVGTEGNRLVVRLESR